MNYRHPIWVGALLILSGCAATLHPDYEPVFQKQSVPAQKVQEVRRRLRDQGLAEATVTIDSLGRIQLTGSYDNEGQVERAFVIAREVVGDKAVSGVRPDSIKQKDWEISASKGFANFIEDLARKFKMSVHIEQQGADNQIAVSDKSLDGIEQFAFGSGEPTDRAAQFYRQMAAEIAKSASEKTRKKRLLIVGHTDDVGDSEHNAALSERRARSIGKLFESANISGERIFYQGAGEMFPIGDNRTEEGRGKNRRVEIIDVSNERAFAELLAGRKANVGYYRPAATRSPSVAAVKPAAVSAVTSNNKASSKLSSVANPTARTASSTPGVATYRGLDFGGAPVTENNATLPVGDALPSKKGFFFIGDAHASDMAALRNCSADRPRVTGAVKSLKDGLNYSTSEFMPMLNARSWSDIVGGHLVLLNKVAVLRDGGQPSNLPTLKVYANYKNPNQQADVEMTPKVNTYPVTRGLLYRMFAEGTKGVQCVDVLFALDARKKAVGGKLIYGQQGHQLVSDYSPEMF